MGALLIKEIRGQGHKIRWTKNSTGQMGLAPLPDSSRGHLALLHLLLLALLLLGGQPEGEGPERPPGLLLLVLGLRALALHGAAVTALGVGASLLLRAVEAVAVRAVGALVTLGPD